MKKLTGAIMICLVAGCSTTPNYDTKFGDAVREARMRMTIDPDAGKKQEQLAGMDGKAAQETIVRYQDSYKSPPPVINVINIGGAMGGGNK